METDHLKEKKTNGLVNTFKSTTRIIHLKLYVRYFSCSTPTYSRTILVCQTVRSKFSITYFGQIFQQKSCDVINNFPLCLSASSVNLLVVFSGCGALICSFQREFLELMDKQRRFSLVKVHLPLHSLREL